MAESGYNKRKFRELLLYIAGKSGDDAKFGDTKLNKLLYYCDFLAYARLGHPITGATYQKLQWGPAPTALLPVRDEMIEEGALKLEKRRRFTNQRTVTVPQRIADTTIFEAQELQLVDEVIDLLSWADGAQVSELSHMESAGWNLVDMNQPIPYETALLSDKEPSAEVIERGRELAERFSW